MLADLVEVTTEDGIALGGAYFAAHGTPSEGAVDAVCLRCPPLVNTNICLWPDKEERNWCLKSKRNSLVQEQGSTGLVYFSKRVRIGLELRMSR